MSIFNFYRELSILTAEKQPGIIDALTEEAPILGMIPMQAASSGFQNVYENLVSVQGAETVDLDDELPEVDLTTELKQQDLGVIGGKMYVGDDKARKFGGASAYFNSKLPSILRETGANTEKSMIYNSIRKFAIDNGNVTDIGGSSNKNFSAICVKWVPGETIGLFDETGPGNGKAMEVIDIGGKDTTFEKEFTLADGTKKSILVKGVAFKTYFGLQLANDRNVSAMVNVDIDSATEKFPTEAEFSNFILNARANPANTYIYMHPRFLNALKRYKSSHMDVLTVSTTDMDFRFNTWDGIPIITSYNFLNGTETNV